MRADEIEGAYYSPQDDKFSQAHLHDTRRPRLTLVQLNKLKKMRAAKDLENLMRGDFMQIIYGGGGEEGQETEGNLGGL